MDFKTKSFLNYRSLPLLLIILFVLFLYYSSINTPFTQSFNKSLFNNIRYPSILPLIKFNSANDIDNVINIWIVFINAPKNGHLVSGLRYMLKSLFDLNDAPLHLNLVIDQKSKYIADIISKYAMKTSKYATDRVFISFYDSQELLEKLKDIIVVMTPHFSAVEGSYFSAPFYYISFGLHLVAPVTQKKVVLLDCDLVFNDTVSSLYHEFDKFSPTNLFGMAHELSPVYRYGLNVYRSKNNDTFLGSEPSLKIEDQVNSPNDYEQTGFPGYNSGVMLLNLERIRNSSIYSSLLSNGTVDKLTNKYSFKGHLGDQDYFTLLKYEYPDLFYTLDCGWNRQLCQFWQISGKEVFDKYYKCESPIHIYHKNCRSPLPPIHNTPKSEITEHFGNR